MLKMKFRLLCEFFQTVKETKGANEKSKIVQKHLHKFRELLNDGQTQTIFPILRLILPKLDRDRASYSMKESKISRTLIKMLDLPQGNDRNILTKSYLSGEGCDFGEIVYSVIRKYIANYTSQLTIQELNSYLDDIAKRKSESEAEQILFKVFKKSSPEDSKWIIRIILKDLKLGIDGNRILNCFHKDAANFYSSNNNLKKVCEILSNPDVKLHELEIGVFDAFRPMLSKKVDAATFKRDIHENKTFFVENKFDGERFQLHMKDNTFKYFSRNGFDFTETYGDTYNSGIFTPKLTGVFKEDVQQIILDGEMMLWNKRTKKFGSKGMHMDVKKLHAEGTYQPCFCVYDILLVNESIVTNQPLQSRLKTLRQVLTQAKPGTIIISEVKKVSSRQEIIRELNNSMDNEEEGIIVKDPNSIYKYSDRNSGWFKMKLEYFSDLMNDLDVILMGGCYSSTSKKLNSFIIGVRSGNNKDGLPVYLSLGKISSGLNYEQIDTLNKKLKTQGFSYEQFARKTNNELEFGKEVPNYWIEPKNTCVLLVRASELVRSTDKSFKTPYTLRFPRVLSVRNDKPVDECLTMNELLDLTQQNKFVIKLNKRNIDLDEILNTKTRTVKRQKLDVGNLHKTSKVSEILMGLKIFVLNGNEKYTKDDIENIVTRAEGSISYKLDSSVDIVLVGKYTSKVSELAAKHGKYDIVDVNWLQRALEEGEPVSYEHSEVYYIGWNYKNFLADDVDMFGDSYTTDATVVSLKKTFQVIKDRQETSFGFNLYQTTDSLQRNRFAKYCAYFDRYEDVGNKSSQTIYDSFLDEIDFKYYNGEISEELTSAVNLIVYNGDSNRKEFLKNYLTTNYKGVEIVSKEFLHR